MVLVKDPQKQEEAAEEVLFEPEQPNVAEPPAGELMTINIAGVPVNFHWAPAGTFEMGSPSSEQGHNPAERQHTVTLTKGFWIAETETTQQLWQAVLGINPSAHKGSNLPVDNVSWDDCQEFLQMANSRFSGVLPKGYKYALPTEAQWEYACRAGTTTPYSFGSKLNGDNANCNGSVPYGTSAKGVNKKETTPVMSYPANAWGLYDMHGNVWEWTLDFYSADYGTNASTSTDPTGPDHGTERVVRGGSWAAVAASCRSARRGIFRDQYRDDNYGFRLVLVP